MIFYPHVTSYGPENYNTDTYLTQGLGSTLFITASPLEVVENPINEAKAVPLVYTTDQSVFRGGQFITINESGFLKHQLDEMRGKEESKKYLVAAAMTGKFTSYFKGKAVPKPKPKPQPGGGGMSVPGIRDAIDPRGRGPRGPGRFPRKLPPGPPKPKKGEPKKVEPEKAEPKKGEAKKPAPPVRKEQPKKPEGETKTPPAPGKPVEPKEPPVPEKPAAPEKKPDSPEPGESEIEEIDIPGGATQDPPPSPDSPKAAPPAPPTPPKPDKTEEPEPKKPETAKPDKAKPEAAKPKPAEPGPGVPGVPGPGVPGAPPAGGNETVIEPVTVEKSGWSQVAVISDDRFIISGPRGPHWAPRPGRPQPGTFVQRVDYSWRLLRNLLEWMLEDSDIVQIRGRGMQSHVLKSDITTGQTMIARIINLSLMPLIIIFAALLRWALKRRRRRRLAAMEVE
ncbi:MAG: hypothetical protein E3J72_01765 [Planctomycetota bacterium]|nr:MAG: hypothetical protein E3J72_01765 [Planctomycetota bacterium]